jgi:O-antigen/teichoic acid export membrane protein
MKDSLFNKTLNGLQWTTISTILSVLIQVVYMAIISRLLNKEDFGLIALANTVIGFSHFFATLGLGQALVQKEHLSKEDIRVIFTLGLCLGSLFFCIIWVSAPYIIRYMYPVAEIDKLTIIVRYFGFSVFLSSLGLTASGLMRRNFDFKRFSISSVIINILQSVLVLFLAYRGLGVWSLVIGAMTQSILNFIIIFSLNPHSIVPLFDLKAIKPLFSYGTNLSSNSVMEYINQTMDKFLIGRFYGAEKVGLYTRVNLLFYLPSYYLTTTITRVLFPALSRMQNDQAKMRTNFLRTVLFLSLLIVPFAGGIAVAAESVISISLGSSWVEGASILRLYGIASVLNMITMQSGVICDATAYLRPKLILNVCYFFVVVALFYIFKDFDLVGLAGALVIAEVIRNIAYAVLMRKVLDLPYLTYYRNLVSPMIVGIIVSGAIYSITLLSNYFEFNYILLFVLQALTGMVSLGMTILFLPLPAVRKEMKWLLEKLSDKFTHPKIARGVNWYINFLGKTTTTA